ncbi:MAG: ribbon-helix-helix domain-containing protein [Microbacterium sp.]|jgi:Arc/MetJ-type ribon-helix-helix transcriptional regulator|nr:ribbon-helix-helix domain-containing protein [Microbacterium sp.]
MSYTKVSLSLSEDDVAFLDSETLGGRYASRSAAAQDAVRLLRESRLADAYAEAFAEDYDDEWDAAADDGLASA